MTFLTKKKQFNVDNHLTLACTHVIHDKYWGRLEVTYIKSTRSFNFSQIMLFFITIPGSTNTYYNSTNVYLTSTTNTYWIINISDEPLTCLKLNSSAWNFSSVLLIPQIKACCSLYVISPHVCKTMAIYIINCWIGVANNIYPKGCFSFGRFGQRTVFRKPLSQN